MLFNVLYHAADFHLLNAYHPFWTSSLLYQKIHPTQCFLV